VQLKCYQHLVVSNHQTSCLAREFKTAIVSQVILEDDPHNCLTNSGLEMMAVLIHYMVVHQEVDMQFSLARVLSDNMPRVAWTTYMANKSQSPTAGHLLQGLAAIQQASQAGPLIVASIAVVENCMADNASRSFGQSCVPNAWFLTQFTHTYPLLQQQSWKHVLLTPENILLVALTLHGT
jgi:hypothetical protein